MQIGRWISPLALVLAACVNAPALDETRLLDLTQPFGESTVPWPGEEPFRYERDARRRDDGRWLATGKLSGSEQSGTYLDAPLRYSEGRASADTLALARLIGPIRVIDVTRACAKERDYRATVEDLREDERSHGRIPAGAAVLVRTGWGRHFENPERYFGGPDEQHFPGLSLELARELVGRKVEIVGIDTASIEGGTQAETAVHRALATAEISALENLAALEDLPTVGATLIALPMKLKGSGGGPTRVVALVP